MNFIIRSEEKGDDGSILALHQSRLGPGRFAKTSYRIREQADSDITSSCVAIIDGEVVGSVRQTWVYFKPSQACLFLGPLVVDQKSSSLGIGQALLIAAIERAEDLGAKAVILIGDHLYYQKVGFEIAHILGHAIDFPGPVDHKRLLIKNISLKHNELLEGKMTPDNKNPSHK